MQITEKPIAVEKSDQFRQTSKVRAPRNRTLTIGNDEKAALLDQTISLSRPVSVAEIEGESSIKTSSSALAICQTHLLICLLSTPLQSKQGFRRYQILQGEPKRL